MITLLKQAIIFNKGSQMNYNQSLLHIVKGSILSIEKSKINKLYVTDTIDLKNKTHSEKIKILSAADLFSEAIRRTFNNESISSLFNIDKG